MSLERMTLRLATVMALANGFEAPFPTMAAARVHDTRIDAVQITNEDEVLALITVNTDDDTGTSISANNGGPPFERAVTLSIDLHMGLPSQDTDEVMHLATESDLERRLDLFEHQIERVLTLREGTWGAAFDQIARRITDWSSIRYVERNGNVRLAARQIQATVLVPLADWTETAVVITPVSGGLPLPPPSVPSPLGPLLDTIIDSSSPFAADAARIRSEFLAGAGGRTSVPPLQRVRIVEDERDDQNRRTNPRSQGDEPGVAQVNLT